MVAFAFTTNTRGELVPIFDGLKIKCACTGEMADRTKVWTIKGSDSWYSLHYIKWGGKRYYYFLLEGVK